MATYFSSGHFQGRNASCPASFRHCLRRAAGLVAAIEVGAPTLYLLAAQLAASRALGGGKGVWRRLPDFFCPESEVLTTGFEETGFLVAALTSSALLASVATIDGWLESIAAEPGRLTARMGVPPTTRGGPRTVIACPTCSGPSLFTNRIRGAYSQAGGRCSMHGTCSDLPFCSELPARLGVPRRHWVRCLSRSCAYLRSECPTASGQARRTRRSDATGAISTSCVKIF